MIRKARFTDITAINDIYNYEVINGTATFDTENRSFLKAVSYYFNHRSTIHSLFVYELNNSVVGFCSLSSYRQKTAFRSTVEISLYVHVNHRNKGIGSSLLSYVINYAKKSCEISNIVSVITSENKGSLDLFFKAGFIKSGSIEKCGRKFNRDLGITNMYLLV